MNFSNGWMTASFYTSSTRSRRRRTTKGSSTSPYSCALNAPRTRSVSSATCQMKFAFSVTLFAITSNQCPYLEFRCSKHTAKIPCAQVQYRFTYGLVVGAASGKGGVPNGVGVCTIGVGVVGAGTSKFNACHWKRRKAKRKATMYPIHHRTAHLKTSACANPLRRPARTVHARVRAALSSRKSSSRRRGLILMMSAKSIFPQLPAARSELAALHRANP